jgi:glyoxylase-like metal-dependent hydrolase (beta-lactamase superfamily II)
VIVEVATHPQFVSNTYLVHDGAGGPAFFIDAGGPVGGLIDAAERAQLAPTHLLLTHHHYDHVCEADQLRARWPGLEVLISPLELELWRGAAQEADRAATQYGTIEAGDTLRFGALEVRPLHTPGHTAGMLSFLVGEPDAGEQAAVFTGDTLFKGSVGGVKAPGHTTYADLRDSIMGTLMELPPQTVIYPGHAEATTVGAEYEANAFIRIWRGLDDEGTEQCTALGQPATLVLLGRDYDGGTKAWVRWPDGSDDIVPGSRVERSS